MGETYALAGNPNAGKTSLFNVLTGTRQYVGNWPGVTVEKKEGWIRKLPKAMLIDLPGIYSLSSQSLEEKLAISYLLQEKPDAILNIVDASNLERNLYLSLQLLEMGIPCIMIVNMMDVAKQRGWQIDLSKLEKLLGIPVVPMVARKGEGLNDLLERLANREAGPGHVQVSYSDNVEQAIAKVTDCLQELTQEWLPSHRWLATMWLERNESVEQLLREVAKPALLDTLERLRTDLGEKLDEEIRNARYRWIEQTLREVAVQKGRVEQTWSDRIDHLVLHRIWGIPIFFLLMFLIFQITFSWIGAWGTDWLDGWINGPLHDGLMNLLVTLESPEWFTLLLTDGIVAGVGSVLVFVPQIAILFLCLSVLEDSGYMARAAVVMDRFMRMLGLNGKAFIPLLLGFGCNVPAIMATRTLEDEKGRLVTSLIAPFMSCSARLPVYILVASSFFAQSQAEIVFLLYLTGISIAILTAYLLKKYLKGEEAIFMMEMPPYRAPMLKSLLLHTWDKAQGFIRKAGTIIFAMSVVLWFLSSYSWSGQVSMNESFLAAIGGVIAPIFAPLGFGTWQAGVSLVTGFMAKEVVVSTMAIVYGAGEELDSMAALLQQTLTPAAAIAFLFFILLYTPCLATVGIMKRETGSWKWTIFSILYSFTIAWVLSFVIYHLAGWFY